MEYTLLHDTLPAVATCAHLQATMLLHHFVPISPHRQSYEAQGIMSRARKYRVVVMVRCGMEKVATVMLHKVGGVSGCRALLPRPQDAVLPSHAAVVETAKSCRPLC